MHKPINHSLSKKKEKSELHVPLTFNMRTAHSKTSSFIYTCMYLCDAEHPIPIQFRIEIQIRNVFHLSFLS